MDRRLKQQGNQADKLLPEVYEALKAGGAVPKLIYTVNLDENNTYTVHIEAEEIGIELGDILASKVQNAGELIVTGSTGMIAYTRAADSTDSAIYFTDNMKDGKLAVLTYTTSNKTITASIV